MPLILFDPVHSRGPLRLKDLHFENHERYGTSKQAVREEATTHGADHLSQQSGILDDPGAVLAVGQGVKSGEDAPQPPYGLFRVRKRRADGPSGQCDSKSCPSFPHERGSRITPLHETEVIIVRSSVQIKLSKGALCFVALLTGSLGCHGQSTQVTPDNPGSAEIANASQYQIGPGDVLDIRVYNRPLLSRESVRVDENGTIRLPLINEVRAACLTEGELADSITTSYREYLKHPHVEVFIKDYQSKPVVVVGAVREPGRFQMQRRVHLVEIISLAGGLTEQAAGRIQVTHALDQGMCSARDAGEQVEWYEMKELLASHSNRKAIVPVRPGDTINLLEADKIYVIGNVVNPVAIPLKEEVTISQAVAMAGGTLPASNLDSVRVTRQSAAGPRGEIIVNLKAVSQKKAEDIRLQGNDIVEVQTSTGKRIMQGLLNSIVPTATRLPLRIIP